MNFGPREINAHAFEEYGIKSDSSSTLGVSQVIEWEGQSFSTVSAMELFFYGAGSYFIKQHVSVQSESNVPFENLVRTYCTWQAMQNIRLMKENATFLERHVFMLVQ